MLRIQRVKESHHPIIITTNPLNPPSNHFYLLRTCTVVHNLYSFQSPTNSALGMHKFKPKTWASSP
ncbi:unnamed protein product, partial [Allacma fusca]